MIFLSPNTYYVMQYILKNVLKSVNHPSKINWIFWRQTCTQQSNDKKHLLIEISAFLCRTYLKKGWVLGKERKTRCGNIGGVWKRKLRKKNVIKKPSLSWCCSFMRSHLSSWKQKMNRTRGKAWGEKTPERDRLLLRHPLCQRNSCGQLNTSICKIVFRLLAGFQRPYVMRSSTPTNEILHTFHKVHLSFPSAWSSEMKSLLRKVD